MEIKELKPNQPRSAKSVVELLRSYLDKAFSEKITYLEITARINGTDESTSISTHEVTQVNLSD